MIPIIWPALNKSGRKRNDQLHGFEMKTRQRGLSGISKGIALSGDYLKAVNNVCQIHFIIGIDIPF